MGQSNQWKCMGVQHLAVYISDVAYYTITSQISARYQTTKNATKDHGNK